MAMKLDRISITYDLTFETPFHCGTGLRAGLIDRTIVRDHDDYLYVPGSTIKGVVREHCERLERMYNEQDQSEHNQGLSKLIASPHDARKALLALGQRTTMVARIFGSHSHPGHLFFEDARQSADEKKQYDTRERDGKGEYKSLQTDLYTQVRLDRPTRTAVSGALYTSEFGIRDVTLHGSINGWLQCTSITEIEQEPTYSLVLLLAGLSLLDRIGGNKSTGKGKCRCEIKTVTVEQPSPNWQAWLEHLDVLANYATKAANVEEEI
jgi:CRISPR/Cas system CMR subunit Cmr4 (Cas7 group RAMP superfamily)